MIEYRFRDAVPVWEQNRENEMNYNLVFRCIVKKSDNTVVNIAASNLYQMFVNGEMIAQGPARAGHSYYRVDEIDITEALTMEENIVVVYVNSYGIKNFYLINQPGFLCAEVVQNGEVVAATGKKGFEAKYNDQRLRYVGRFSSQRTFDEIYRLNEKSYKAFETQKICDFKPVQLVNVGSKNFIEREVPYPCYDSYEAKKVIARGRFEYLEKPVEKKWREWITMDTDLVRNQGYLREDTECMVIDELDKCVCVKTNDEVKNAENSIIGSYEWQIFDFGFEKTGFIALELECESDAEIILSFDEVLTDGDIDTRRLDIANGVVWFLSEGKYSLICNEPNSLRFVKIANKSDKSVVIRKVGIKEYAFDYKAKCLGSKNEKLNAIYKAAVETFRQNTVDIYMDCPSRERGGYLCDSYFTAKVEKLLTGKSVVEKSFLENFIIAENFTDVPDYMFAMCYPSDFADHVEFHFIPNWAMWYVIELEEYFERSGDRELVDRAREKIEKLYNYFESFRNSDGLLEKLEKWVFVEWSKANEFVQDVNYPTNMLYCRMLQSMGRLYDEKYSIRAQEVCETIRKQSFYDGFFHDHAVRNSDGTLVVADGDISETCQYYAFFTNVATIGSHSELWQILLNEFGPDRESKGLWKEIHPSAPFIGNYLRLLLLDFAGEKEKLLDNIEGYFYSMSQLTNTLWESNNHGSSHNHGFASMVAVWLDKYAK